MGPEGEAPPNIDSQAALRTEEREDTPMSTFIQEPRGEYGTENATAMENNNPELWYKTTENDITVNGKGLRCTATLEEGWPQVYLAAHPSYNIAPKTLREWRALGGPTLWARLYRACYEQMEAGRTKIEDAIKSKE